MKRESESRAVRKVTPISVLLPAVIFFLFVLILGPTSAWAQVTINVGDILVVDGNAFGGAGGVIRVNPSNGAQTEVTSHGLLQEPAAIVIESTGKILVTDRVLPGIIRIDPALPSGSNQTIVRSGAPFVDPFGIALEADGSILITDTGCPTHNCSSGGTRGQAVFRVNPATGAVTVVSQRTSVPGSSHLDSPYGIAVEDNGNIVVTDATSNVAPFNGAGGIIRINPVTGIETAVHVGTAGVDGCPFGTAVEPISGNILNSLIDPNAFPGTGYGCSPGSIWRANPVVDQNTVLSPHSIGWQAPFGMDVDTDLTILVIDEFHRAVFRVNPSNGAPTLISQFGFMFTPTDVAVATPANTPSPLSGADLSVTKTDGVTTVTAGDGVTRTYTIVVNNAGPLLATSVNLSDTWPTGFTQGAITPSQGNCTSMSGGNFTCALGNLAPGASATVTVNYTVPSTTPAGPQTNSVSVSSSTSDPSMGNNNASDTTTVTTSADISVTKTDGVTTVTAGDGVTRTYTITVTNAGPSQAAGVSLTDMWPTGFTQGAITPSQGSCNSPSGGDFTCGLGTIASGGSATVTVNYTVPSTTPAGTQTNTASVSSSTFDPSTANNSASDSNTVANNADLSVTKTDGLTTVVACCTTTHTYTITVSNAGPSQATNVILTDTWPSGFHQGTITPSQGSCTPTGGGNFTCALGNLASGTSATVTVTYTVPITTPGGPQTNSVSVTSSTADNNTSNNNASDTTTVVANADLSVSKTDGVSSVTAGDGVTYTYTISVVNNGPSLATAANLDDLWPGGFTRGTITPSQGTCTPGSGGNFNCSLGNIAPGGSATVTVNYTVPASTAAGNQTNTVCVNSSTNDPTPANNEASDVNTVVAANANLAVSKTDGVTTVTAGDGITRTYIITVNNAGPSESVGINLSDTWPSGFTRGSITPSQGSCSPGSGGDFTCALGNLAPVASATVSVQYTVPASTPGGTQTNTVSVTSTTPDPNSANNTASDSNTVNPAQPPDSADLKLIKTDSADPVNPSSSFDYTLAISNLGPQTATNLSVTDTLPSGVTFVSASGTGWTCNHNLGTVTCTKSSLSSGASSAITITVTAPAQTGTINNTASVTSSTSDPNTGNNSDSESTTVAQSQAAKWTGSGEINVSGGKASFGFTVERSSNGSLSGQLEYFNHVAKYRFRSLAITSMTVTGNKVVFTGTGQRKIDGNPWSGLFDYTVTAYDFEPDSNDRFKIEISDGTVAGSETTPIRRGQVEQVY